MLYTWKIRQILRVECKRWTAIHPAVQLGDETSLILWRHLFSSEWYVHKLITFNPNNSYVRKIMENFPEGKVAQNMKTELNKWHHSTIMIYETHSLCMLWNNNLSTVCTMKYLQPIGRWTINSHAKNIKSKRVVQKCEDVNLHSHAEHRDVLYDNSDMIIHNISSYGTSKGDSRSLLEQSWVKIRFRRTCKLD